MIKKLRKEIPDICLRTTLITGFPGETEDQHEELMQFVDEMEFDRLGVFTYSPEEDTPAAVMPDQIAEEVKEEYEIKITDNPSVLDQKYEIVVIGTNHKIFNNLDMNKILTDKGFVCDIYGIHKVKA